MQRRRRSREFEDEPMELQTVLEPYDQQEWDEDPYEEPHEEDYYDPVYQQPYAEEYSDEHEAADNETRFRFAVGALDVISILAGIVVILVLVAMLVSLVDWLQSDILHSVLLFSSELK